MALETHRWVRVRWESDRRYYEAHLHQDLWGTWVLTRTWGGRRSARGQTVHQPCADQAEGRARLAALDRARRRHGYRVVLQHPPGPARFTESLLMVNPSSPLKLRLGISPFRTIIFPGRSVPTGRGIQD